MLPMTPRYAAQLYWAGRGNKTASLIREMMNERQVMEGASADNWGDRDNYPLKLAVDPNGNQVTLHYIRHFKPRRIAEIGIYEGDTAIKIAKMMGEWNGVLHVYDFQDRIDAFMKRLDSEVPEALALGLGNSYKYQDSYNWRLAGAVSDRVGYDYVFIDGAHTWNVDALTFLLVDRLLNPGGIVDFDDYDWTVMGSPSLNPEVFPRSAQMMTDEQMRERQVKMVVDFLVKPDPRYVELFPNKIFRKVGT